MANTFDIISPCSISFKIFFSHDVLLGLVENNKQTSNICFTFYKGMLLCYASFDLWMYKEAHDVFTLVIIFWGFDLKPKHVTLSLCELLTPQDMHWQET